MNDRVPAHPWRRFVALGDSFTEGLCDDLRPDGRHRGWADRVAETLATVNPELEYANLAVRGRLLPAVVDQQVPAAVDLRPDLVTLAAGVNDALRRHVDLNRTATALENGVRALRGTQADVVLFAFGDPGRRSPLMAAVRERIAAMNRITYAIADVYGCRVVDFWGRAAFDDDRYWDADRLHLSPAGHALAAAAVLETLGMGDDAWRTPVASGPRKRLPRRVADDVGWATGHLGPWVVRRLRGRSSGDGVTPKQPSLEPVIPR